MTENPTVATTAGKGIIALVSVGLAYFCWLGCRREGSLERESAERTKKKIL